MSTPVTIWGCASKVGGISQTVTPDGRLDGARSYRQLDVDLPAGGIEITADHGGAVVGELVYAEIDADQRLNLAGVLEDDRIAEVDCDVYFSGEFLCLGRDLHERVWIAERARVIGLALVTNPGSMDARPLRWRRGDIRDPVDRSGWPLSWGSDAPLLKRAVDRLPRSGETRARATRIVAPPPTIVKLTGEDGTTAYLADDELVASTGRPFGELELRAPADPLDRRPVGELRRGPRGRILSVR